MLLSNKINNEQVQEYIKMGSVWLTFKNLVREQEDLSGYLGNIAFSLSSRVGWGVRNNDIEFYYPPGIDRTHPFDLYVPIEYVTEKLLEAVKFSFFIREKSGLKHNKSTAMESIFGRTLSKFFTVFANQNDKPFVSKQDQLKRFVLEAQQKNIDKAFDGNDLKIKGWQNFSPSSGQKSPFYLSADEQGGSFDFIMRRNP